MSESLFICGLNLFLVSHAFAQTHYSGRFSTFGILQLIRVTELLFKGRRDLRHDRRASEAAVSYGLSIDDFSDLRATRNFLAVL